MARKKTLNVSLLGQGFMGRTHSNAWGQVRRFFDPPLQPVMYSSCDIRTDTGPAFAERWGWQHFVSDMREAVKDPEVGLVDIALPNNMHAPAAVAALQAGRHVALEKPLAGTLADARKVIAAARKARRKTFVWYNYRRVPAVALAHQFVRSGRIGTIRHIRAFYLQDWADESVPLLWRFDKKLAGSGAHGDLAAHIIDMVRFVSGHEIAEIAGALFETFIKQRTLSTGAVGGGIAAGVRGSRKKGRVTVDDCVLFLARTNGGAVASFEAARQATGNQNRNGFEINGTKGSLKFNFERMNELEYYDATADRAAQGWTTIMCTHGGDHPYVAHWWPDAHLIGYQHTFVNQAYDILRVLAGQKPTVPIPDVADAYKTQCVLEAVSRSAASKKPVKLSQVK